MRMRLADGIQTQARRVVDNGKLIRGAASLVRRGLLQSGNIVGNENDEEETDR
jgi:hypothetical protein